MKFFYLLLLLIVPVTVQAQQSIQFFGDILLSRGIQETIEHEGVESLWKGTDNLFSQDAVRVANLEGAIGDKSFCAGDRQLCFHVDLNAVPALRKFDVISLANNHSMDLGLKGRSNTIHELKKLDIIALGGKQYSTFLETENGSIGIIALTDVVNSPRDKKNTIMADSPQAVEEIKRLKGQAGLVAVYIHWGRELDNIPSARMRHLARTYINAGADIIVGHHPHVLGKTECVEGKPVIYSLGNFLFDQKYEETKTGAVLQCSYSKDGIFRCRLAAVRAPMDSFIPKLIADDNQFNSANEILARCTLTKPPAWQGIFSKDRARRKYTLKRSATSKTLYSIQRVDDNDTTVWKSPGMPIEKIQPVDLNGDGVQEVMLIQNIFSTLDNEVGKRVYIYKLDNGLTALWRGSGLSRPLLDAVFGSKRQGKKPILIALHTPDSFLLRDPNKTGCILMSYRWNGFGFSGIKEKRFQSQAVKLSLSKEKIRLINKDGLIVNEISMSEFY